MNINNYNNLEYIYIYMTFKIYSRKSKKYNKRRLNKTKIKIKRKYGGAALLQSAPIDSLSFQLHDILFFKKWNLPKFEYEINHFVVINSGSYSIVGYITKYLQLNYADIKTTIIVTNEYVQVKWHRRYLPSNYIGIVVLTINSSINTDNSNGSMHINFKIDPEKEMNVRLELDEYLNVKYYPHVEHTEVVQNISNAIEINLNCYLKWRIKNKLSITNENGRPFGNNSVCERVFDEAAVNSLWTVNFGNGDNNHGGVNNNLGVVKHLGLDNLSGVNNLGEPPQTTILTRQNSISREMYRFLTQNEIAQNKLEEIMKIREITGRLQNRINYPGKIFVEKNETDNGVYINWFKKKSINSILTFSIHPGTTINVDNTNMHLHFKYLPGKPYIGLILKNTANPFKKIVYYDVNYPIDPFDMEILAAFTDKLREFVNWWMEQIRS